jgi:hypothetical protein
MSARDRPRPLAQSFETENLSANRTDEFLAGSIAGAAE